MDENHPKRKSNPGMIFDAVNEYNIDVSKSMLIGDKMSDIEAGINANINSLYFFKDRYKVEDIKGKFEIIKDLRNVEL